MRKKLLRSALMLSLAGVSPMAASAESFDFDGRFKPEARDVSRAPLAKSVEVGSPRVTTDLARAADPHFVADWDKEAERKERAALRAEARRDERRARRQVRMAEKDLDRAHAYGGRASIRLQRHELHRARGALRRAIV
ncbi:MAG: hypothetical protein MRY74_07140 [Neomegalonema sp.]|nr:hypothetical protein [Neomegalonema sp.]